MHTMLDNIFAFISPNICQHSLAAAEDMSVLREYLAWVRNTKATGLNLFNLICKEIPVIWSEKYFT